MSNSVLLRFRDLTQDVNTIEVHNKLAGENQGRVLWGWWKKPPEPMPDPGLTEFQRELKPDERRFLAIDSGSGTVYEAPLYEVTYQAGGQSQPPPKPEICPAYYSKKELPAWFEIGQLEELGTVQTALSNFVFSADNRTSERRSDAALHKESVGQTVAEIDFLDSNVSLWFVTPMADVGVVGRSKFVPPIDCGKWPTKGCVILHLSDLHFGDGHAFRNHLGKKVIGKERLLDVLLEDLSTARIGRDEVAVVLVSGDLTWKGESHEFANAEEFLIDLANHFGLHRSQVLVVPGNHDVEWVHEKGDIDENAELNYRIFCERLYGSKSLPSLLRIARFEINGSPFSFLCLNSCRIESKANAGLGFVGKEQLSEALHGLTRFEKLPNEVRMAIVHHHVLPVNFVEDYPTAEKHVSIMLDAEAVVRNLIAAEVDIVVHGHQHQPYFTQLRRVIEGFVDPFSGKEHCLDGTLTVIGGGSIGVKRGHLNVIGRHAYNLFEARDHDLKLITRVQSAVGPGFATFQELVIDGAQPHGKAAMPN